MGIMNYKDDITTPEEKSQPEVVRSRVVLDLSFDTLAKLLKIPDGLRILNIKGNMYSSGVRILVEGEGNQFIWQWKPGEHVVVRAIESEDDITKGLYRQES